MTSTASPGLKFPSCEVPHHASQVDAAHQRITPQDSSCTRGGQRVLVVDARVMHLDDDFTRRELFERQVFEKTCGNLSCRYRECERP